MKILAIDTSSNACSVALLINGELQSSHKIVPQQQAQLILPMINELIEAAGISLMDLTALAFGCGPGSFTGIRIAASVAQGLAFANSLPVISVSSLSALAQAAYDDLGWKKLLVGIDARMQEIYWAAYQINTLDEIELIGTESVCSPSQISAPSEGDWYGVGDAWGVYQEALLKVLSFTPQAIDNTRLPMASAIAKIAQIKYKKGDELRPEEALPVYLRNNVATKKVKE